MVTYHYSLTLLLLASIIVFSATSTTNNAVDLPVDFTVSLNVDKLDKKSYLQLITTLRKNLASLPGATEVFDILVLPPQPVSFSDRSPPLGLSPHTLPSPNQGPDRWFHLQLKANKTSTTIRIRGDTLSIVGYKMQNSKVWLELTSPNTYINGSEDLGFGGEYKDLEIASDEKSTDIVVNKPSLTYAVMDLASSTDKEKRAKALLTVSLTICEASKFNDAALYIAEKLHREDPEFRKWMMEDLVSKWVEYSTDVLCYSKYGREYNFERKKIKGDKVKTVQELCKRLNVILLTNRYVKDLCKLRLPREELLSAAGLHPSY